MQSDSHAGGARCALRIIYLHRYKLYMTWSMEQALLRLFRASLLGLRAPLPPPLHSSALRTAVLGRRSAPRPCCTGRGSTTHTTTSTRRFRFRIVPPQSTPTRNQRLELRTIAFGEHIVDDGARRLIASGAVLVVVAVIERRVVYVLHQRCHVARVRQGRVYGQVKVALVNSVEGRSVEVVDEQLRHLVAVGFQL
jgi:hypothetical protein